jgi:hypothetical protein
MSYADPDEQYYQYLQKQVKGIDDPTKKDDASCCKHVTELEQQLKQCQSQGRSRANSSVKPPLTRGRLTYKPSDEWLEKNFMRKKKNDGSLTDFGGGKRRRTNKRKKTKRTKRTNKNKKKRTKRSGKTKRRRTNKK